jgi:predicted double-glycine peptidase
MLDLGPDDQLPPMPAVLVQLAAGSTGHQTSAAALTAHGTTMQGRSDLLFTGAGGTPWLGNRSTVFQSRMAQLQLKLSGASDNISAAGNALQQLQGELQSIWATNQPQLEMATQARSLATGRLQEAELEIAQCEAILAQAAPELFLPGADVAAAEEVQLAMARLNAARIAAAQAQMDIQQAMDDQQRIKIRTADQYQQAQDTFAGKLRELQGHIDSLTRDGSNPLIISPSFAGRAGQSGSTLLPGAQRIPSLTPGMRQATDGTCGAAAAANVLAAREINVTQAEAVQLVQNTPNGSTLSSVASGLNAAFANHPGALPPGTSTSYVRQATLDQLASATALGVPAVVGVRVPGAGFGHAITVDGVENGMVFYRDPWSGMAYQIPAANFMRMWTGQAAMLTSVAQ